MLFRLIITLIISLITHESTWAAWIDPSFDATYSRGIGALQADGKIIFWKSVNYNSGEICRLNLDGSLDPTFHATASTTATTQMAYLGAIAVQGDGKVLVRGSFTLMNGIRRSGIARLNADGSLDSTFEAQAGTGAYFISVQSDGKALIMSGAGYRVARLNTDGSLDATFNCPLISAFPGFAAVLQADGKLLVHGGFFDGGVPTPEIVRLNPNGTIDPTFNTVVVGFTINSMVVQSDGKIMIAGRCTTTPSVTQKGIARLNADGTIDTTFNPGTGATRDDGKTAEVYDVVLQADGKVIITGDFSKFNGTALTGPFLRLKPDGSVDPTYSPELAPNTWKRLLLQSDGKVLTESVRYLNPDAAQQTLSVSPGGYTITWALGGSFPQPYAVMFEDSDNGTAWKPLGVGIWVPGIGFRLSGLRLPVKTYHYVRATGWTTSGENASVSMHRAMLYYYDPSNPFTGAGNWTLYQ